MLANDSSMWWTLHFSKSPIFSLILMITIYFTGIYKKSLSSFCLLHYTPTSSDCLKLVTTYLITFLMTPSYFPSFEDALVAIDGSHFNAFGASDRNGTLTTNTLAICNFTMWFLHTQSDWEGSVADAWMLHNSGVTDLSIPNGKYFLADAGFLTCSTLLIQYRGTQ